MSSLVGVVVGGNKENKLSLPTITSIYIFVTLWYIVLYCLPKSLVFDKNCGICKKKNSFGCNR